MEKTLTSVSTLVCYEGNNSQRRLRKFLKSIERNINNIIEFDKPTTNEERKCKGFQIKIDAINGVKKIFNKPRPVPEEGHFYIRYFMNMFSLSNLHFYGNTYRSPQLAVVLNETGHIILENPEPFYAYCLSPEEVNDVCIIQFIFVEATKDDDIVNQTCEGWSILPITSNRNPAEANTQQAMIYFGSPRDLVNKEIKSIPAIQGASINYSISSFPQLETIKFLIPDYIIVAEKEEIPGLAMRFMPKEPKDASEIRPIAFDDVYLKNIDIEFNTTLEDKLIAFANHYRQDKYNIQENQFNKVSIKERKLKCGVHNTWCFINSNGLENSITLTKRDNTLYFKGVHLIDHFFSDEMSSCALIIELNYTIIVPIAENQKEETLSLPIGYSVFVPDRVTMENNFRNAFFITGPGVTVYGDHLWDPLDLSDKIIKINFILSKSKETVDRTYRDKNLQDYNTQMEEMKTSIINEYNQALLSKNQADKQHIDDLEEKVRMLQTQVDFSADNRETLLKSPRKEYESSHHEKEPEMRANETQAEIKVQESIIQTEKIISKSKEDKRENSRYDARVSKVSPLNQEDYSEFLQFKDYKKKVQMYKSSESLGKELEDNQFNNKIIYEESTKDISRKDKAGLIAKGVLGLDINERQRSIIDFTFEKELTNTQLAHQITFQFLTYKPRRETKRKDEFPNKFKFKYSFWNCEDFTSAVCSICKDQSVLSANLPMTLIKEGTEITSRDEDKEMSIKIKYDPSHNASTDLKDFINYLLNKQMLVMITDAESLLEFGYFKIPLRDLIRQGKSQTYQTKEYDILNQDFDIKGSIQMLIKSVEATTIKPFQYNPLAFKVINSREGYNVPKKKKIVVKAIDLNKLSIEDKEKLGTNMLQSRLPHQINLQESMMSQSQFKKLNFDPDIEKKVRAMRYMKQKGDLNPTGLMEESKLAEANIKKRNDDNFFSTMSSIGKLKELKKESIISRVAADNHKNTLNLSLIQGQPHYVNYVIYNESEIEELFHIVISSSFEKEIPIDSSDKTISVITTPEEWRRIVDLNKLCKPNDFNCISSDYYLSIKPNESVPIIIKFLSYEQRQEPTTYTIWIHKKNGHSIYYFCITIPRIFPIIDHIFQYNVPCSQHQKIILVNPFKYNKDKTLTILKNLICTDISVHLQVDPNTLNFAFQYSTKEEGYMHQFLMFFYLEETRSVLYATWKFEIYCKEVIHLNANIGSKLNEYVQIEPVTESKTLQLFSEYNDTLFFPEEFKVPFVMVPNARKEGLVIIYPKKDDRKEILMNCVNIYTRELYKSWLFKLATHKPTINEIKKIDCIVGSITNVKYQFKNPMRSYKIFNFDSNNEDIFNVIDTRMQLNAEETCYVNLSFPSQSLVGKAEALMFIYDNEELFSQIVLFQITYK